MHLDVGRPIICGIPERAPDRWPFVPKVQPQKDDGELGPGSGSGGRRRSSGDWFPFVLHAIHGSRFAFNSTTSVVGIDGRVLCAFTCG